MRKRNETKSETVLSHLLHFHFAITCSYNTAWVLFSSFVLIWQLDISSSIFSNNGCVRLQAVSLGLPYPLKLPCQRLDQALLVYIIIWIVPLNMYICVYIYIYFVFLFYMYLWFEFHSSFTVKIQYPLFMLWTHHPLCDSAAEPRTEPESCRGAEWNGQLHVSRRGKQ